MLNSKYGTFLTVMLVIITIGILGAIGWIIYTQIFNATEDPEEAIRRFERAIRDAQEEEEELEGLEYRGQGPGNNAGGRQRRTRTYYEGFVMVGHIEIPATGIRYPILERATDRSLDVAVAVMWPENPEERLNRPGNVVIMGHNYRNRRFFSRNNRLNLGDTIYITDIRGSRVRYVIYQMFETTAEDTSYITRHVEEGVREITLTTCTDDSVRRFIVQAREG